MNHDPESAVARADQWGGELTAASLDARPKSFGAPKCSNLQMLRKDMARGHSKAWMHVLRVALADVADGVPIARVVGPFELAVGMLSALARSRRGERARTFPVLQQQETVRDGRLDAAQLAAAEQQLFAPAVAA